MRLGLGFGLLTPHSSMIWANSGDYAGMFTGADDHILDFVNNRYTKGGQSVPYMGTSTHSGDILALNSSGTHDSFAANAVSRNDLGLQVVPTRTNVQKHSNKPWLNGASGSTVSEIGDQIDVFYGARVVSNGATWHRLFSTSHPTPAAQNEKRTTTIKFKFGSSGRFVAMSNMNSTASGTKYPNIEIASDLSFYTHSASGFVSFSDISVTQEANGLVTFKFTTEYLLSDFTYTKTFAAGPDSTVSGEYVDVYFTQDEQGSFATPPIITGASAVTVLGNEDVVSGLNISLGIQAGAVIDVQDPGSNYVQLLSLNDGTGNNSLLLYHGGAGLSISHRVEGVDQGSIGLGLWPTGLIGVSVSSTDSFSKLTLSGGASVEDLTLTFPAMSQMNILGKGYTNDSNTLGRTKELFWRTGQVWDATSHAEMETLVTARRDFHSHWSDSGDYAGMFTGADDHVLDFVNNRYAGGGASIAYPGTSTHSSDILALNSSGTYDTFGANVVPRNDLGLQVVPTRLAHPMNSALDGAVVGTLGSGGSLPTDWSSIYGNTDITEIGTEYGLPFIEIRLYGTNNSGGTWYPSIGQKITQCSTGTDYTFSCGVKKVSGAWPTGGKTSVRENGDPANVWHNELLVQDNVYRRHKLPFNMSVTGKQTVSLWAINTGVEDAESYDFTFRLYGPQLEEGSFATPPIITQSSAVTVLGNEDVISGLNIPLGVQLGAVIDIQDPGSNYIRLFDINDGSVSNSTIVYYANGHLYLTHYVSGVSQGYHNIANGWQEGLMGVSFTSTTNYAKLTISGGGTAEDLTLTFPAMSKINILGTGYTNTENTLGRAKELCWRTGQVWDAPSHADMDALVTARLAAHS